MQSLQMRWPVPGHIGLSMHDQRQRADASRPRACSRCISEIFSSSGQPVERDAERVLLDARPSSLSRRPLRARVLVALVADRAVVDLVHHLARVDAAVGELEAVAAAQVVRRGPPTASGSARVRAAGARRACRTPAAWAGRWCSSRGSCVRLRSWRGRRSSDPPARAGPTACAAASSPLDEGRAEGGLARGGRAAARRCSARASARSLLGWGGAYAAAGEERSSSIRVSMDSATAALGRPARAPSGEAELEQQLHPRVERGQLGGGGAVGRALLEDAAGDEVALEVEQRQLVGQLAGKRRQLGLDVEQLADEAREVLADRISRSDSLGGVSLAPLRSASNSEPSAASADCRCWRKRALSRARPGAR